MGKSNSKEKFDGTDLSSPNMNFMRRNYGDTALNQVKVWMNECGFPEGGSFSMRQLKQLRLKLEEKERVKHTFQAEWKGYGMWLEEAQRRDKKQTFVKTDKPSQVSQCFKMQDSDLDSAPPRRQQPAQLQAALQADFPQAGAQAPPPLPPLPPLPPPPQPPLPPLPPPYNIPDPQPLSPPHTRGGGQYGPGQDPAHKVLCLPMVEVAGPDGHAILVHRPWTTSDIQAAMSHLPSPSNSGGVKFAEELLVFCREFRPTSFELRRLLMAKMGNGWAKIAAGYPQQDLRMVHPDWDNAGNAVYMNAINNLGGRIEAAFPVRMDMTKISVCKQEEDESVHTYLTRLTEAHNTHSGLTPPPDVNAAEITPWEAHLRNSFINGLRLDVANLLKRTCIQWDSGKLSLIESHAVHAEKLIRDGDKRKKEERETDLHHATLTMFAGAPRGYSRGRGRGRSRGGFQGRRGDRTRNYDPNICFFCGEKGHWAKDCPGRQQPYNAD